MGGGLESKFMSSIIAALDVTYITQIDKKGEVLTSRFEKTRHVR